MLKASWKSSSPGRGGSSRHVNGSTIVAWFAHGAFGYWLRWMTIISGTTGLLFIGNTEVHKQTSGIAAPGPSSLGPTCPDARTRGTRTTIRNSAVGCASGDKRINQAYQHDRQRLLGYHPAYLHCIGGQRPPCAR